MTYIDAMLAPVASANREAYLAHADAAAALFREHGALSVTECWGVDVPTGVLTSMPAAVLLQADETVALAFIAWPSKHVRDAAWERLMEDPRMTEPEMPFDGKRLIFGGFETILER